MHSHAALQSSFEATKMYLVFTHYQSHLKYFPFHIYAGLESENLATFSLQDGCSTIPVRVKSYQQTMNVI